MSVENYSELTGNGGVSVTRKLKKLIENAEIRKNVRAIYISYEEELETNLYYIYFKEHSVKSVYSGEYMDYTTAQESVYYKGADAINGWLHEVAYVEK